MTKKNNNNKSRIHPLARVFVCVATIRSLFAWKINWDSSVCGVVLATLLCKIALVVLLLVERLTAQERSSCRERIRLPARITIYGYFGIEAPNVVLRLESKWGNKHYVSNTEHSAFCISELRNRLLRILRHRYEEMRDLSSIISVSTFNTSFNILTVKQCQFSEHLVFHRILLRALTELFRRCAQVWGTYECTELLSVFTGLLCYFFLARETCFRHSISLNTTCAPPPLVGNTSAWKFRRTIVSVRWRKKEPIFKD